MRRSNQVTFACSDQLLDALDADAFAEGQTRAGLIRSVLAIYLRSLGLLDDFDPLTGQLDRPHMRELHREARS